MADVLGSDVEVTLVDHRTCGAPRPMLRWRFPAPVRCASTAVVGGGIGGRSWLLNAQVPLDYDRHDLLAHAAELAAGAGCDDGGGVVLLTAATVGPPRPCHDGGVICWATVGVTTPAWAAGPDASSSPWVPGTVNVVVHLPVRLDDAALVNAVATATEAKSQALWERGVPGTGTASDAVVVTCPTGGVFERFGGPRSTFGARLARATHAAVLAGLAGSA